MKKLLIIFMFIVLFQLLNALPPELADIQKQVARQAGAFHNSPSHQKIRMEQPNRSYVVGDTRNFWRWNLAVMPPPWIQVPATCRAVGAHSYLFVANSEWNVHMTQANVDSIMVRLEERTVNDPNMGAIEMDVNEFGPIPDELDNDPKIIVFYSALGSFQGSQFDGYFSAYNQVTEAEAQLMEQSGHSNECEMIYMTCSPLNPVAPVRLSVLAHELTHMIEWGLDPNEETWIDEGLAELAMVKYGIPDPITDFNGNPDNSLTLWDREYADYVKVMLFFTYLSEHYDTNGLIRDIISDPTHGRESINNQIASHFPGVTFQDIFRDWTIANYIDHQTNDSDLFTYFQLDIPQFTTTYHFTDEFVNVVDQTGTVQPWAADYIKNDENGWYHIGDFGGNHPFQFSYVPITNGDNLPYLVFSSSVGNNFEWVNTFWLGYYILVISNPSDSVLSYHFSILSGDGVEEHIMPPATSSIACYPNPYVAKTGSMNIQVKNINNIQVNSQALIYNIKGQLISKITLQKSSNQNSLSTEWNGRDREGKIAASGMYMIRYQNGDKTLNKKFIILQ